LQEKIKDTLNKIQKVSEYDKPPTLWENPLLSELKIKLIEYKSKLKSIYYQNWFLHYTLNEIKKEFFDVNYFRQTSATLQDIPRPYMLIYFKYNILDTNNPRDIPKIVRNISYKYRLNIQGLEDYEINGHFNQKGQYDFFRITNLNYIGENDSDYRIFLLKCFQGINKKEKYSFIKSHLNETTSSEEDKKSLHEYLEDYNKKLISGVKLDKKYSEMHKKYPELKKVIHLVLNQFSIVLQVKAEKFEAFGISSYTTQSFNILRSPDSKGTDKRLYNGILSKEVSRHYYEKFTFNRLTPKLPERQKLQFYGNMLITENSLTDFLKEENMFTTTMSKEELLSLKLVQILDDTLLLNKLFAFTSTNYQSTHIFDGETDKQQAEFEIKVMKNIVEILFNVGTPFYISRQKVRNRNNTNKRGYSTYTISNINDTIYFDHTRQDKNIKELNKVEENDFIADITDPLAVTTQQRESDPETTNQSIILPSKKDDNSQFAKLASLKDRVEALTFKGREKNKDNIGIVLIDFDLMRSSAYGKSVNCKTRKKRIQSTFFDILGKKIGNSIQFTRKMKNLLKGKRQDMKRRKSIKNSKARARVKT
jgi:hypothetical protein